jgi:hypothetical protein
MTENELDAAVSAALAELPDAMTDEELTAAMASILMTYVSGPKSLMVAVAELMVAVSAFVGDEPTHETEARVQ